MISKLAKRIIIRVETGGEAIRHGLQLRVVQIVRTRRTDIEAAEHSIAPLSRLHLLVLIQVVLAFLVYDQEA